MTSRRIYILSRRLCSQSQSSALGLQVRYFSSREERNITYGWHRSGEVLFRLKANQVDQPRLTGFGVHDSGCGSFEFLLSRNSSHFTSFLVRLGLDVF